MEKKKLTNVPAANLETTVKTLREDDATEILITKNSDGTFNVETTFPN